MVPGLLERKNRDFFRQVTLVVDGSVTSKYEAKLQFRVALDALTSRDWSLKLLNIP
jgi:hypothetical protein